MKLLGVISLILMAIFSEAVYAGSVTNGMVAYWQFNGSAVDQSGTSNDGTLMGDATYVSTTPSLDQSLYLDGDEDYIRVSDSDSLDFTTAFSATMWINPDSVSSTWQVLFSKWLWDGGSERNYCMRLTSDDIYVQINETWTTIPASIVAGQWQQLAFTYDNSVLKIYYNGVYLDQWAASGPMEATQTHFLIGATPYTTYDSVAGGRYFNGYMDEFKLFNRTLSDTEVLQEYNYVLNELGQEPVAVPEPTGILLLTLSLLPLLKKKFI